MRRILIGVTAMALSSAAFAQAGMAPSAPPNGTTPNGATPLGSPGDSGSGMGTMDTGPQSMASDPATTDKGMTKPHSKHRQAKSGGSSSSDPASTSAGQSSPR